jgi:multidrug resistance efflux pump
VAVADNQAVKKGDLLYEIDPSAYELAVLTARANLDQVRQEVAVLEATIAVNEAMVEEAKAAVTAAKGEIEAATARVESGKGSVAGAEAGVDSAKSQIASAKAMLTGYVLQRDRAVRLAEKGAGPQAIADALISSVQAGEASVQAAEAGLPQAQAALDQAKAALTEAEANELVAKTGLGEAEARLTRALADLRKAKADLGGPGEKNVRIRSAEAALKTAELNLLWTRVEAPADGYVTNVRVFEGEFAAPGTPLLAFVNSASFRVAGFFRETQVSGIQPGDKATVTLMSDSDAVIEGEVESIGWAINPPNMATYEGPNALVPQVQPVFDWIRLAQRVPVRVKLTSVPKDLRLISGTTVSVAIETGD